MTTAYPAPNWFRHAYFPDRLSALRDLQYRAQLSNAETAHFLGVTVRTLRRWQTPENTPPEWARLLLAMRGGYIPWDGWDDWHMQADGRLMPPHYFNQALDPWEIMAMPFQLQLLRELKRQVREFNGMPDQTKVVQTVPPGLKKIT